MLVTPHEVFPLTIASFPVELAIVAVPLAQINAICPIFLVVPPVIIAMVSVVISPFVIAIVGLDSQRKQ
jgi:hypothetical protein